MKRLLLIAVMTCVPLVAEDVQKIIELKHTDVGTIRELLTVFGVEIRAGAPGSHVMAVRGNKESVAALEEAIKRLDVPQTPKKNIELTVYMILADGEPGGKVPPELEGVVKQLRGLFQYSSYQLLESFQLRTREEQEADLSGFAPPPLRSDMAGAKAIYQFKVRPSIVPGDKTNTIRLDRLRFGLKVPVPTGLQPGTVTASQWQYIETGISTEADVREGQKVVIGKASASSDKPSAVVLALSAKIVE